MINKDDKLGSIRPAGTKRLAMPEKSFPPGHKFPNEEAEWQGDFVVEGPGSGNMPYEVSGMATSPADPEPELMTIAVCWSREDAQKIADALNAASGPKEDESLRRENEQIERDLRDAELGIGSWGPLEE
jgi:hypothetical protein